MKIRNKVCLITGAAGFLGTATASAFARAGFQIFGVDILPPVRPEIWAGFSLNGLENVDLARLLGENKVSVICHLAGSSSVAASVEAPFRDFISLVPGTARLLAWNAGSLRARVLLFSSAAVYGNANESPIGESGRVRPISPYGIHKAVAELLLQSYGQIYNFESIALRIFSAYGPGLAKQVIFDIANKALQAKGDNKTTISLFGTGEETRDFVFVDDIAEIAVALASKDLQDRYLTINIGSGKETKISEIAYSILKQLDINLNVSFSAVHLLGTPEKYCANVNLLRRFGCMPKTSLEEGLKHFAAWFKSRHAYVKSD